VALFNVSANGQGGILRSATIVHPRVVLTAAHCALNGLEVSRRIAVLFEGGTSWRHGLDAIVHPASSQACTAGRSALEPAARVSPGHKSPSVKPHLYED
jgi:hypothetical protein